MGHGSRRNAGTGFSAIFDPICSSRQICVNKPDPQAFGIALEAMAAAPEAVLFIDNRLANVEAAQAIGMQAQLDTQQREHDAHD